jgi:nucleoside phosphorylase
MEAYCVASVCGRYGIPCSIYKAVSDNTNDDDTVGQIEKNLASSCTIIGEYILSKLDSYIS